MRASPPAHPSPNNGGSRRDVAGTRALGRQASAGLRDRFRPSEAAYAPASSLPTSLPVERIAELESRAEELQSELDVLRERQAGLRQQLSEARQLAKASHEERERLLHERRRALLVGALQEHDSEARQRRPRKTGRGAAGGGSEAGGRPRSLLLVTQAVSDVADTQAISGAMEEQVRIQADGAHGAPHISPQPAKRRRAQQQK